MINALITHADEPLGRKVVKALFHDEEIGNILAVGDGPPPRSFDRYLSDSGRVQYARVDLAKHRPTSDLFRGSAFKSAEIDTVVHIPRHGAAASAAAPIVSGLPERTAETRLVLQNCLETASVQNLIALGSAFVYRLHPGNSNRLDEDSELDLDPDVVPQIRSWIDCDMIFHGEVHNDRMRVVLLRVPTIVAEGGYVRVPEPVPGRATRAAGAGVGIRPDLRPDLRQGCGSCADLGAPHPQVGDLQRLRHRDRAPLRTGALDAPHQHPGSRTNAALDHERSPPARH